MDYYESLMRVWRQHPEKCNSTLAANQIAGKGRSCYSAFTKKAATAVDTAERITHSYAYIYNTPTLTWKNLLFHRLTQTRSRPHS